MTGFVASGSGSVGTCAEGWGGWIAVLAASSALSSGPSLREERGSTRRCAGRKRKVRDPQAVLKRKQRDSRFAAGGAGCFAPFLLAPPFLCFAIGSSSLSSSLSTGSSLRLDESESRAVGSTGLPRFGPFCTPVHSKYGEQLAYLAYGLANVPWTFSSAFFLAARGFAVEGNVVVSCES